MFRQVPSTGPGAPEPEAEEYYDDDFRDGLEQDPWPLPLLCPCLTLHRPTVPVSVFVLPRRTPSGPGTVTSKWDTRSRYWKEKEKWSERHLDAGKTKPKPTFPRNRTPSIGTPSPVLTIDNVGASVP